MKSKGRITLDDIAMGITYNNEPYTSNKKFSVIIPDIESQHKFFTIQNYTHKYLEKVKRSPFIEYLPKKRYVDDYSKTTIPKKEVEVSPGLLTAMQPGVKLETNVLPEIKEKRSKSSHRSTHKGQHSKQEDRKSPITKGDRLKNKYEGAVKLLNIEKVKALDEALIKESTRPKSRYKSSAPQKTKEEIEAERIKEWKVPNKKVYNNSHIKATNPGYSRTVYGGFFMH